MKEENFILISTIRSIKILGLVGGILGAVSLIVGIDLGWPLKEVLTTAIVVFLSVLLRIVAEGLSKRKRWAWYTGISVCVVGLVSIVFIPFSVGFFVGLISGLILFGLLFSRKKYIKLES